MKLFGTSRIKDGRVLAYVAPVMINKTSPLYSVNDVFNGIFSKGQYAGDLHVLRQRRRKSFPQAARWWLISLKRPRILKGTCPWAGPGKKQAIESMDQAQFRYFVRVAGSYRNKEQDVKMPLARWR